MKRFAFLLFFLTASVAELSAQSLSVGVKGGVPLIDGARPNDESRPYIIGPSVELRLPANFALEADGLYQRIGATSGFALLGTNLSNGVSPPFTPFTIALSSRIRGNDWTFPLLGKYYLPAFHHGVQPFIAAGFAFRTVGFQSSAQQTTLDSTGAQHISSFQNNYRSDLGVGAAVAAGVRIRAGRFALAPEFRYTRWGQANSTLRNNEAQVLLGLSF